MDFYGINVKDDVTAEGAPNLGSVGSPFGTVYGESTSAKYADLAEKYTVKGYCPVGTVVSVSKDIEDEVELCQEFDVSVVGVVSQDPAFKMNDNGVGIFIGLVGKLPVRIVGFINKSDFIVPAQHGCARAGLSHEIQYKIGVALETSYTSSEKLIMCFIK